VVILAQFATLLACTEYTQVHNAVDVANQPEVRVTLTGQGRVNVGPRIGLRAVRLEGLLQSMTDSSLSLSVRKVSREGGIEDCSAATYQTPTLDRLRLLSMVKRTAELPRSDIDCDTKLSVPPILRAAILIIPI